MSGDDLTAQCRSWNVQVNQGVSDHYAWSECASFGKMLLVQPLQAQLELVELNRSSSMSLAQGLRMEDMLRRNIKENREHVRLYGPDFCSEGSEYQAWKIIDWVTLGEVDKACGWEVIRTRF